MYLSAALTKRRNEVMVWERTKAGRELLYYPTPYYFYVRSINGKYKDIHGNSLTRLDFDNYTEFKATIDKYKNRGDKVYESDIRAIYKVLAEHYTDAPLPATNITLFDIEVDYDKVKSYSTIENPYAPVSAIALHHYWKNEDYVLVVPPPNRAGVTVEDLDIQKEYPNVNIEIFKNERELLLRFLELIEDSDILSGWNSSFYDVPYLYERLKLVFNEAMANRLCFDGAPPPKYREVIDKSKIPKKLLDLFGRESVDYMEIFKKFEVTERRSYSLEAISEEKFPDMAKLEYDGSLYDLYRDDFEYFIKYNIRDCEILKALEDDLGYIQLAIQFANSSTGLLSDVLGTTRLAELAIINFNHAHGDLKAEDTRYADGGNGEKFTGALVLNPIVGMHKWVAAVDVMSLYPSAMRAVNISPETIVGQFFDTHKAYNAILNRTDEMLFFKFENGDTEERTAKDWRQYLLDTQCSISGYGSVFTLKKQGCIPAILTSWFAERKRYKKALAKAKDGMKASTPGSAEYLEFKHEYENAHRLQYVFKIRLNSLYGALGNKFFKYYDVRLAESTTRCGRNLLMHMDKTVAKALDGEYTYPSESIVYSDTDSCYFKTYAEDLDGAIKVGQAIEHTVNAAFPAFCAEAFLCTPEYRNLIFAELDVVASKSIFIKKKYYVMQTDYADGSKTDKIKLMGVQLKKTTIPKKVAQKLTSIVQSLLKDGNWRELSGELVEYNDHMMSDAPYDLIGIPGGVKNVTAKEEEYKLNPKAKLSGGESAAIFYNLCLEQYGDTESFKILSGMKIRRFKLKKKFGRFKSIALPSDLTKPPVWFMEHFYGIIDRAGQYDILVTKPLGTILSAIDVHVPTAQSVLMDDLLTY